MSDEIKNTLEKQLALLSERSMKSQSVEEIVLLTEQMISLAAALEGNQSADGCRFPCGVQLSGTDLTDMICGRETRLLRHSQSR